MILIQMRTCWPPNLLKPLVGVKPVQFLWLIECAPFDSVIIR